MINTLSGTTSQMALSSIRRYALALILILILAFDEITLIAPPTLASPSVPARINVPAKYDMPALPTEPAHLTDDRNDGYLGSYGG
jgi:hypothetical protein